MNIVFLDIDGVMVSSRCYFSKADSRPRKFDPLAIDAIKRLCNRCDAKIVFNTVWNRIYRHVLIERCSEFNLPVHKNCHTEYPDIYNRLEAIQKWLTLNNEEEINWVSLDDAPILHKNAILVDSENGISAQNYRDATVLLGYEDPFLVML